MLNKFFDVRILLVFCASLFFAFPTQAFDTVPQNPGNFANIVYPSQNQTMSQSKVGSSDVQIVMNLSCYGTNLRSVGNPIAPASQITTALNLGERVLNVTFPGSLTAGSPTGQGQVSVSGLPQVSARVASRQIVITIPNAISQQELHTVKVGDDGSVSESVDVIKRDRMTIKSATFSQTGVSGGAYYARAGRVTNVGFRKRTSNDGKTIQVSASFPGQNGFCGGYYSPLMAFFDDERPNFKNISEFPLHETVSKTHWPEANAPGYFLAIDRDGNGHIDRASELFGDSEKHKNGFGALRTLDVNGDGEISKADPSFSALLLWHDKNGNGKSEPNELQPLQSKSIISISLSYKSVARTFGKRAEEREQATFKYLKGKKTMTGAIVDIWLAPADNKATLASR